MFRDLPANLAAMVWGRLQVVRAAVLVLGGFAALCVAAFLFSPIAGWVAVGGALLTIEFLTNPESREQAERVRR